MNNFQLSNHSIAATKADGEANGFTFVEVIVALLIMSILISGLMEVIRLSLIYRTRVESDAARIQSAMRINAALTKNLSGATIANTKFSENQISIYTRPIKQLTFRNTNIGKMSATMLEVSTQSKGISTIIESIKLPGVTAYFLKVENAPNGFQTVFIYDRKKSLNSPNGDNLIALLPIYANAERPCIFENITSQCRNSND